MWNIYSEDILKPEPVFSIKNNHKRVPNIKAISDLNSSVTNGSAISEDLSLQNMSIPKSPTTGRPHIKTNGALTSSNSPSDAEDKTEVTQSLKSDMRTTKPIMQIDNLPKRATRPTLQRQHSQIDGINRESYIIENQIRNMSGTASLERNMHLQHRTVASADAFEDQKRLSGWLTLGRNFQRRSCGEFERVNRTTWGGGCVTASKKRESLKVLDELDNAYHYSSDSCEDIPSITNEPRRQGTATGVPHPDGGEMGVAEEESDDVFITANNKPANYPSDEERIQEYLSISISGMYGIFLLVIGTVMPLAETFADPTQSFVFEAFYIYLYIVSVLLIVYVYIFMIRKNPLRVGVIAQSLSRRFSSKTSHPSAVSEKVNPVDRQLTYDPPTYTGSFYLRLGAVMFGVGSMIDSGLHVGQHFQVYDGQAVCNRPVEAVKPFCRLIFTFTQLYFIFLNSKVCFSINKTVSRFLMMHMCGTNICVWFQSLVLETMSVIEQWNRSQHSQGIGAFTDTAKNNMSGEQTGKHLTESTNSVNHTPVLRMSAARVPCHWDNMMTGVVETTGPYLYPCTIEYSLICTGILYVMWQNVGKIQKRRIENGNGKCDNHTQTDDEDNKSVRRGLRVNVDCTNSSRGLFSGILVSVGVIITVIAFYVMVNQKIYLETAVVLVLLSETVMYLLTIVACILAAERMHKLRHYSTLKFGLEENLILLSFTGLAMFGIFNIIPDMQYTDQVQGVLNVLTNILMILQASLQTILVLTARRIRALNKEQENRKPGRQFVSFLFLCNFALWILDTFQNRRPEHNPIQVQFYRVGAWATFTHIVVPLAIFFRYQSAVYLFSVWKSAWNVKKYSENY